MVTIRNYVRPSTLEEAWKLNQAKSNRVVGGMMWMRLSNGNVNTAIDLCDLGLDKIEETETEFSIGAMVTLRQLELCEAINRYTNHAVRDAVKDIVGTQFRNMATIGGSIFGRFGFSDVLTVFLGLDTYVELYKGGIVSLEEFTKMKRDKDILVRIIVKKTPVQISYKTMRIAKTDFPVIACAVSWVQDEFRAVVGARPQRAMVIRREGLGLPKELTEEEVLAAASYVAEAVPVGSNMRGSSEYRTHLIKVLVKRAILEIGGKN